MKTIRFLLIALCSLLGEVPAIDGAVVRREVPVRFSFPASYAPLDLDSGWVAFPPNPILLQMHGYLRANAVPYTFDACAKLVFAFEAGDVWAGNTFACQVWLEPYDAPDLTEVRSDFGCEFGVELRERFSQIKTYAFTKDFLLAIEGNGGLPLGNQLLGGWDTLEFAALPIDELIPGSGVVKEIIQGCLDVVDANGVGIATLDLMGELVVQGHYVRVRVGETDVELTQPGAAHAQTAYVYVPLELGETLADCFDIALLPVYNFSIWKGIGAKLTAVGPLSINLAPDNFDPDRLLPGAYVPPSLETVTSCYQQAVTQASATLRETPWLAFPISGRPPFPDLTVHDMVVNPGEPQAYGRAYANEPTTIGFTLRNIGGASTQLTDDMVVRFFLEGEIVETRILNNMGATPKLVLKTNECVRLSFEHQFDEGRHAAEIRCGLASLKGYAGSQPVYGLGDPFLGNNGRPFHVYCAPGRGTVIGRVFSNPSYPGEGINGIRVRLSGPHRTVETVSAYDAAAGSDGIYRFERIYPGDYMVEYLTGAPTNAVGPRYYPRSLHVRHELGVTDLREGSGLFMRQYQRLHGRVRDGDSEPVKNALVTLGDAAFLETRTDGDGRFVITNVPPSGAFVVVVDHPDYLVRRVRFNMSVSVTEQTDAYPSGYFSLPDMTWIDGNMVVLAHDEDPPVVELLSFDNDGRRGNPLAFHFHGSDQDGRFAPESYCWQVRSTGGAVLLEGPWTDWPTNAPPGIVATATADISSLADLPYCLHLRARDRAGNEAISEAQAFTLDKTPPQVTVAVAEGAAVTASRLVSVDIAIGNTEPGTLMLELSNDGATWSEPWFFIGSSFRVSDWELTHREAYSGPTITVHARVTDAVWLQTTATDDIQLATVGAVRLAGGWEAWTNTVVPLQIDIVPPDGLLKERLFTWAGTLKVGGNPLTRYRAQAFVLPDSITFNRIRLGLFQVVGDPAPLTLRVVNTLNHADPTGVGGAVWSWTGTAEDIRLAAGRVPDGKPPATSGTGTVLPAGTNYVIFACEEVDPDKYYEVHAGRHLYNGDGGLRHDHNGGMWVVGSEDPPGMGVPTFTLDLYHSPNGEIRICTDGTPDTEPWVAFPYPDDPFRTVTAPGEGLFTAIVDYRNTVDASRDGTHLDTIIIDGTPPVVHGITILATDPVARGVLLDLNVTDARTRMANMSWRFDEGPWQVGAFRRKPFLYCPASFSTMTWIFRDAAANETAPRTFSLPVDMSLPTLKAEIGEGHEYTIHPEVVIAYTANDDTGVGRITLREARTDTEYPSPDPAGETIEVELPQVIVGWKGEEPLREVVDGAYVFEMVAYDTSGNASETVLLPITLDREPPLLDAVELTGARGEAPATGTNLVLHVRATDNLGPMELRWRWQGGTWSGWQPIADGRFGMGLAGYQPLPTRYEVDVQVRDIARWAVGASCGVAVNRPPETPVGIRPFEGTGDPPFLFGSDFHDPDGDAWGASQYVLQTPEETALDTGPLHGADRYAVPDGWLRREEKYQWRCRYFDPYGAASDWSEWLPFDLQHRRRRHSRRHRATARHVLG